MARQHHPQLIPAPPHLAEIAAGRTGLRRSDLLEARATLRRHGYILPPLDGDPPRWHGLGDVIADLLKLCGIRDDASCGCLHRRALLNSAVPFPIHWPISIPFVP